MEFDTISILIGLVLGGLMMSPSEQARLKNYISMGKTNTGLLRIKRKGKGTVTRIVDYNKQELKTPEGTFVNNADRVYFERGIAVAYANDESMELIDLDAQSRNEVFDITCPDCGKENEFSIETLRPVKNPKKITDIVLRSISWGMTVLQDKRTQLILIAVGVGIITSLINAFISWQTLSAVSGVGNGVGTMQDVCMNLLNSTVKK